MTGFKYRVDVLSITASRASHEKTILSMKTFYFLLSQIFKFFFCFSQFKIFWNVEFAEILSA